MSALRSLPLLSLAVAASCALVSGDRQAAAERERAAERLRPPAAAPYDLVALDTWAALHDEAIALSRIGYGAAGRDDVRAYAERSLLETRADAESLSAWRVEWFGDAPRALSATMPGVRFAQRAVDLDALQRAEPGARDRVFLEMRIPIVEAERALAGDVLASAAHEALRAMARQALDEDRDELAELRRLYAAVVDGGP